MDLKDPQHWKERSAEAMRSAGGTDDPEQRKLLREIAALYEIVAERLEQVNARRNS